MERNPSFSNAPLSHKNSGGRPPEFDIQTDRTLNLERPASPTPIDEVHVTKKGRNEIHGLHDPTAIDMDSEYGEIAIDSRTLGQGDLVVNGNGKPHDGQDVKKGDSYAAVTAGKGCVNEGKRCADMFVDEEPGEGGADPLGGMHSNVNSSGGSDIVEINAPSDGVVPHTVLTDNMAPPLVDNASLGDGVGGSVPKNAAYLLSNPSKKSRASKGASNAAKVVPMVDGKVAAMTTHNARQHSDHSPRLSQASDGDDSLYDSRWDAMEDANGHDLEGVEVRDALNPVS
ncbi:hypothetical protein V6N12_068591 [Hibiscus sabdariffa]|uniref:Uncharacterized protein n=1 Tax=Hibiscus sabdariffa TaxID=183260 RepID=A0ABR2FR54_9ROSI